MLKSFLESVLLHAGPASVSRLRHRDRSLILAYHNVVPTEETAEGDSSLHLPLRSFHAQLAALESSAEVVPLPKLLNASPARSPSNRPRVAITFDDAYQGAVTLGLPEVARRRMPATMFVCPGRLGGESFWWDRYAREAASTEGADFREASLEHRGGTDERVAQWAEEQGWRGSHLPGSMHTADETELAKAAELPGITLASHSWSHPNLTTLGDADLEEELGRPLIWLASRFENTIPWLAYPYGIADAAVAAAAAEAGYEAAVRIEGGWLPRMLPERRMLPRLNIPAGLSERGFRLRLAGLLCERG